ncbi:MAG: hypothetical protein M2R45_03289 [Verrucomicrobia subdivision 3 bacterium]|nr:hypothetical protein [Limisphaerales bacterium]MCS1415433.1 hypothetical protein [Limisphaerales bacterium]
MTSVTLNQGRQAERQKQREINDRPPLYQQQGSDTKDRWNYAVDST